MSDSAIDVLQRRLAAGDISLEQYRELLAELQKATPHRDPSILERGKLIDSFEDFELYENVISFKNVLYPLSDIASVRGGQRVETLNFFPTEKTSTLSITLASGQVISLSEDRKFFAGNRHEAIGRLLGIARKITFQPRLQNLVRKLLSSPGQRLKLTDKWLIGKKEVGDVIYVTRDGTVISEKQTISLKTARATGSFSLGSEWIGLNMVSRGQDPYEVVFSEKRGMMGALIPRGALRFTPYLEDIDIVHALLKWLSEPKNVL